MSIRAHVARTFCVFAAAVASVPGAARAQEADHDRTPAYASATAVGSAATGSGLLLDRLSKGDRRLWRAIEKVVGSSDPSGAPRSPTLGRLWEWASTSMHAIHVEMVSPSRVAAGTAGVFRLEVIDPAGLRHVGVIRLCPDNIRRAKASSGPNSTLAFVHFDGLTEAERYVEVLAHELAHAEYVLESPERLAEAQAAQGAIAVSFSRKGRALEPVGEELVRRCAKPLAVLAASEAHAESVEAVVLGELAGSARIPNR